MREYWVCGSGVVVNDAGYVWSPNREDFDPRYKIVGLKLTEGRTLSWKQVKKLAAQEGKADGRTVVFDGEKSTVEPFFSSIFPAPSPVKGLKYVRGQWRIGGKKVAAKLAHALLDASERTRHFEICLREDYEDNYCVEMLLVTAQIAIAFFKREHSVYRFQRKRNSWTSFLINEKSLHEIISCTRDKLKITIVGTGILSPLAYSIDLKTNKSRLLPPELTSLLTE